MTTGASTDDSRSSVGRIVAWGLVTFAAARVAGAVLASASMPAAVAQALLAEWGASRVGVAWSNPPRSAAEAGSFRRASLGALVGLFAGTMVVGFLLSTRAITVHKVPVSLAAFAVAIVTAGLYAMRDELLLHGVVLRALAPIGQPVMKVLACGLMSAAAAFGEATSGGSAILAHGLLGCLFGSLWVRGEGAWMAWGAHTAWLLATGALMQGGLFEAHVAATFWGGGDQGALGGGAAIVALLPLAVGAAASVRRA